MQALVAGETRIVEAIAIPGEAGQRGHGDGMASNREGLGDGLAADGVAVGGEGGKW